MGGVMESFGKWSDIIRVAEVVGIELLIPFLRIEKSVRGDDGMTSCYLILPVNCVW
jgi:hypothetical protein